LSAAARAASGTDRSGGWQKTAGYHNGRRDPGVSVPGIMETRKCEYILQRLGKSILPRYPICASCLLTGEMVRQVDEWLTAKKCCGQSIVLISQQLMLAMSQLMYPIPPVSILYRVYVYDAAFHQSVQNITKVCSIKSCLGNKMVNPGFARLTPPLYGALAKAIRRGYGPCSLG
jgi:hypothetical protein